MAADETGLSFKIDPTSAEQGEKRIVKSLANIRAAAEKTAKISGKNLERLAYGLDTLSLVKGPSSQAIRNINNMKIALQGFKAPSSATVNNVVGLLRRLGGLQGPSAQAAKSIQSLSTALHGFKAPTAIQVKNTQEFLKALSKPPANMNGLKQFSDTVSGLTTRISQLNKELLRMSVMMKQTVPNFNTLTRAGKLLAQTKQNVSAKTVQLGTNFRLLSSQSLSLSGALLRTRAAFEGFFAVLALKEIYDINVSFQKMSAGLTAVTGSSREAAVQMDFVNEVSSRLGLNITEVGEGFTRFLGSLQGTAMTIGEAQKVFYGLSQAARVLHLNTQDQEGIFKALGQIMSKGSLQAEELRGQLGDRMPAAFAMMAMAMGKTTAELGVMMKKGEVTGQVLRESLINFSVEYKKMTEGGLDQSVNGLQASLARLGNSFKFLVKEFGESGFNDAVRLLADDFRKWMDSLRESGAIKTFGENLKSLASAIVSLDLAKWLKDILMVTLLFKSLPPLVALVTFSVSSLSAATKSLSALWVALAARAALFSTIARGIGVLNAGMIALTSATLSAGAAFSVWGAILAGAAIGVYKLYQMVSDYLKIGRDLTYTNQNLEETTRNLQETQKDASQTLNTLGDAQHRLNLFTLEDISLKKDQVEAEYLRIKSLRDLLAASRSVLFLKYQDGTITKEQTDWMIKSADTLKTLESQLGIAAKSLEDFTAAQTAAKVASPYLEILDTAKEYGTLLSEISEKENNRGVAAAELYEKIRLAIISAAKEGRELDGWVKTILDRLSGKNSDIAKTREGGVGGGGGGSTSSGGVDKLRSSLKALNSDIDKIRFGDSFGNVDRLVQLNEKVEEYKKALGSAVIPASQLQKIEEARSRILQDLSRDLTEFTQDQEFSNRQTQIDIQSLIDEQNGIDGSKKAQNDLTAAIDLTNLAREESITLRRMEESLRIAESSGHTTEVSQIKDTIRQVKEHYETRRRGVITLRNERNELDRVAKELKGPVAQGFQTVADTIKDGLTDAIAATITGAKDSFSDLWKSLKESMVKGLASMIATAYANPIIVRVLQSVGSSIGMSNGTINSVLNGTFGQGSSNMGSGSSGIGSIGDIFSAGKSLFGGTAASGWLDSIGASTGLFANVSPSFVGPLLPGQTVGTTLSGFLGSAGYGALGGLGANLLGLGGGIGGTIGNVAGSLGGAAIGSSMGTILGMAGGPVGAIIGGFLGTAIGGLFGNKKPTNAAAFGNLNFDTGSATYSHMNKGNSAENMNILKQSFDQVMTFVQGFNTLGSGKITGGISGIDIGVRDAGKATVTGALGSQTVSAGAGQFGQLAINSLKSLLGLTNITNTDVKTAIGKTDFTDLSKAFSDLSFAASFQDMLKAFRSEYTAEQDIRKQAIESAKTMVEQLTEFKDTTARLGLSVADADAATKKYVDNLVAGAQEADFTDVEIAVKSLRAQWDAMIPVLQAVGYTADQSAVKIQEGYLNNLAKMTGTFNQNISDQILAITDPTTLALQQLDAEFDIVRRNGVALGADMAAIEQLYGLKRQQILEESLKSMGNSLRAWLDGELLGSTSTLNPAQKLQEAQNQFGTQLSLARLGDATALSGITGNADALLKAAQDYYASSPEYASLNAFVRASLENLGANLDLPGFPSSSDTITQLIALRQESSADSQETIAALEQILASIDELNRRLMTYSVTSGGRS